MPPMTLPLHSSGNKALDPSVAAPRHRFSSPMSPVNQPFSLNGKPASNISPSKSAEANDITVNNIGDNIMNKNKSPDGMIGQPPYSQTMPPPLPPGMAPANNPALGLLCRMPPTHHPNLPQRPNIPGNMSALMHSRPQGAPPPYRAPEHHKLPSNFQGDPSKLLPHRAPGERLPVRPESLTQHNMPTSFPEDILAQLAENHGKGASKKAGTASSSNMPVSTSLENTSHSTAPTQRVDAQETKNNNINQTSPEELKCGETTVPYTDLKPKEPEPTPVSIHMTAAEIVAASKGLGKGLIIEFFMIISHALYSPQRHENNKYHNENNVISFLPF